MAKCDVCKNEYDKTFTITIQNNSYVFDCFECAIHKLAPFCAHCGCRGIGHGVDTALQTYCCNHCAAAGSFGSLARQSV